ncbi:MAG: S9 family peptidase [Planctomycetota bacterium]|nr:MAG: S9 family peptidase [Planctomycetota bacterium]
MLTTLLMAVAPVAADTHPFSIEDMLAMQRISSPALSPDQRWIAYEVRTTDVDANRGRFDLWMSAIDGSVTKQLTFHEANDTSPRWASDGKSIYFLSTRSGSSQIWRIPVDGGEALPVTKLPLDVDSFKLFADGKRVALSMEVYADAKTLAETAERDAAKAKSKVKALTFDRLFVRHWDTWEDGKRSHLFVHELDGAGEPRDLMKGMDADCPGKPFGGAEDYDVAPDGKWIALICKDEGRAEAWSTNDDLWAVPTDGAAAPQRIWSENKAHKASPTFSPDGKTLALLAMLRPVYESDRQRVALVPWTPGNWHPKVLTEAWDRSPSELAWAGNARLLVSADNLGHHAIFEVDAASGAAKELVAKGTNGSPMLAGNRLVYLHDDLRAPVEIVWRADGSPAVGGAITALNAARVAAARMGEYEQFSFSGAKGETVHGFLVKPVDFDPAKKYPLAYLIHGGPQGSFGDHFHYRWNPQAYAGAGYVAVMVDFHGSTGYGQAFTDAINGDWGGAPFEDLMKGLDHVFAKYAFVDADRVAALGASYGGYMINWIHGQAPDRFRAFVCHDGNIDERMAYYDTEELWFPEWEHGGTPWERAESYVKHNPIDYVSNWKKPTLVIHGALDYRVVDTQGLSTFTALQRRNIPSRLLYFPDENHWVLKPQNSRLWHQTVLGWLDQWVKQPK